MSLGIAVNNGGGAPYINQIVLKDADPQQIFCLSPLTASLPAGVVPGDVVYFDVSGGNAVNVRAAIKTVSRSPQGFEIDTWS
jgi:hypothetical protein